MLYWSIVFLILAWGSAILALGPLSGSLPWIARIAAIAFATAFIITASATFRTKLKYFWRNSHGTCDRNANRKRSVSTGDQG